LLQRGVRRRRALAAPARRPGRGRAALPAALPGLPRGPRVPAAVRGRDRGDRAGPGPSRPAAGHHRPRRRRLHHLHPARTNHPESHGLDRLDQRGPLEQRGDTMTSIEERNPELSGIGRYQFGWADRDDAGASATRGLNEDVVRDISAKKSEPQWMLDLRLKGLKLFGRKPMPTWGSDLSGIDFDNIKSVVRSTEKQAASWEDLPEDIKNAYDKLGIPEAEKQRLVAGVAAQYESEVVYHQIREDLEEQGVIFLDTDTALKEQP